MLTTMQAVILHDFGSVDQFRLQQVRMPDIKAGHVLVQVKATAFNPVDYQMRQGLAERKLLRSPILGREFSGVVVGGDLMNTSFREGQPVYAYAGSLGSNGTYAQYISVPAAVLSPLPRGLSFEVATAVPMAGLTALQCFERLRIAKAASVFVGGGSGSVGSWLLKLLLSSGVSGIVTTAGNAASRQALMRLGLTDNQVIDYHDQEFLERVLQANSGFPFQYCIDVVGRAMSAVCAQVLAVDGAYADITFLMTPAAREVLFDKAATVYHISNYALSMSENRSALSKYGDKLLQLGKMLETGTITPPEITVVGCLCEETVRTAHQLLERNEGNGKKLVMSVS